MKYAIWWKHRTILAENWLSAINELQQKYKPYLDDSYIMVFENINDVFRCCEDLQTDKSRWGSWEWEAREKI